MGERQVAEDSTEIQTTKWRARGRVRTCWEEDSEANAETLKCLTHIFCHLSNDAVSGSDYTESQDRMINE
jgi:hypothetical protein